MLFVVNRDITMNSYRFFSHGILYPTWSHLPFSPLGPGIVLEPDTSQNTSSISLNWDPPLGQAFKYRLEWHNGGALMTRHTTDTSAVLSELIPGTEYIITITAIAGDKKTEGEPYSFTSATSKSH